MGRRGVSTWRSNENGRHDLNVVLLSMPLINDWQLSVTFPLKPTSRGEGNVLAACVVAATIALDVDDDRDFEAVVIIGLIDETAELLTFSDEEEEEEEEEGSSTPRRCRSSCSVARVQAFGFGGGPSSTRMVPDLAKRARAVSISSEASASMPSIICSSM